MRRVANELVRCPRSWEPDRFRQGPELWYIETRDKSCQDGAKDNGKPGSAEVVSAQPSTMRCELTSMLAARKNQFLGNQYVRKVLGR